MTRKIKQPVKVETPKKESAHEKFKPAQIIDALMKTRGMRTLAAKQLGCAYNTIRHYIETYPEVAQAEQDAHESMLDAVELKLFDNCMKGDTTALIFMAKTKGKSRGYVERQEVVNIDLKRLNELEKAVQARGLKLSDVVEQMLQEMQNAESTSAVS